METDPVALQQVGDVIRTIDFEQAWPKLACACVGVLFTMWVAVAIIRKIAKFMVALAAIVSCVVVVYLIASNQIRSKTEIVCASAVLGCLAAVISIPALSIKKD